MNEPVPEFVKRIRTPKAPGDPTKHHYIPQFLLRNFSKSNQLSAKQIGEDKIKCIAVGKAASISNFYTVIDAEIGETVVIERLLAEIEGEAAPIIQSLIREVGFPLSLSNRSTISTWVGLQAVRDPQTRVMYQTLFELHFKMELNAVRDKQSAREYLKKRGLKPTDENVNQILDVVNSIDELTITPHQNQLVQMMLHSALDLAERFMELGFSIVKFEQNGLLLPDHCVTRSQTKYVLDNGLPESEFFIPLDRKTLLLIHHPRWREDIHRESKLTQDRVNSILSSNALEWAFTHPDDSTLLTRHEFSGRTAPLMSVDFVGGQPTHTPGVNRPLGNRRIVRFSKPDGD
jgi:hypothetical protein